MEIVFDIAEDEMQIFLDEANEQIQVLEGGLVRLERESDNQELLSGMFRAAHTLKGSSGLIGHKRMADLTHCIETAFDGVRKGELKVSSDLVDICLQGVDALNHLCVEVVEGIASDVDISSLVKGLSEISTAKTAKPTPSKLKKEAKKGSSKTSRSKTSSRGSSSKKSKSQPRSKASSSAAAKGEVITIEADISPDSVASSARAFQILLALQGLGEIAYMDPNQAQIESAAPVSQVIAELVTTKSMDEISKILTGISDIERLMIGDKLVLGKSTKPAEGSLLSTTDPIDPGIPKKDESKVSTSRLSTGRAQARVGDQTVRTSIERLDNLMNLVGELLTGRNRLYRIRSHFEERLRGDEQGDNFIQTVTLIGRITDQLQEEVMRIRMQPIAKVFNKFPRLVRDLARGTNKEINLIIRGEETELDRSVIEKINDPLIHLLRNAVDHGIGTPSERAESGKAEQGTIILTARHENSQILLTVEDDGKGIDAEAIRADAIRKGVVTEKEAASLSKNEVYDLAFTSGVSTAKKLSEISGRGVGMDIARKNIEKINGTVSLNSKYGEGTRFDITLPLTLAILPTLLVRVGEISLAIPLAAVSETLRVSKEDILTIAEKPVMRLRDEVLPLLWLSKVLELRQSTNSNHNVHVVAVRSGTWHAGLVVDEFQREEDLMVKPMGLLTGKAKGVMGAAILGDGEVALVIDVQGVFKLVGNKLQSTAASSAERTPSTLGERT